MSSKSPAAKEQRKKVRALRREYEKARTVVQRSPNSTWVLAIFGPKMLYYEEELKKLGVDVRKVNT